MRKNYIFAPGPTDVPPSVLLASAKPVVHHRSADFPPILKRVQSKLQQLFQTKSPIALLSSSGTGAVEAAMTSTASPGDTVIVYSAGKFGERWVEVGTVHGYHVVELKHEWGQPLDLGRLKKVLEENPEAKQVVVTHCETSTATVSDVKAVADLVKGTKAISIVDAVSAFAAEELRQDEWGIDMVCTGSQKALMLPPGVGLVSASAKAQDAMKTAKTPVYYFDLKKYFKSIAKDSTPFTPPVNMVYALEQAADLILEEGIEASWARHRVMARAAQSAMKALGLSLFSDAPSVVATAVNLPEGVDWSVFNGALKSRGITIAGGQDHLKGKIFRFATLGNYNIFDMVTIVSAVEIALQACGHKFQLGSGVAAALDILKAYDPDLGWAQADKVTAELVGGGV